MLYPCDVKLNSWRFSFLVRVHTSSDRVQNIVEYEIRNQLKTGAVTCHYTLDPESVVLRLRQAVFVRAAKDIYGNIVCVGRTHASSER